MDFINAPANPLVTVDPYFSIWSFSDKLYNDVTRHWTGIRNAMTGMVKFGGKVWKFMGSVNSDNRYYYCEPDVIEQKNVTIYPTRTVYEFENDALNLTVSFISPLIPDDLLLMSRPVNYIQYDIVVKTGKDEEAEVYFDISAECCVDHNEQKVRISKDEFGTLVGSRKQDVLGRCGDDVRIDYGYLHLCENEAFFGKALVTRDTFARNREYDNPDFFYLKLDEVFSVNRDAPVMAVIKKGNHGIITLAYDDIKSIEYFGRKLNCYYKSNGDTFEDMLKKALSEKEDVIKRCVAFDEACLAEAKKVSDKYAELFCLTFRQTIAVHKLCYDEKGMIFISKECASNGCAATMDVTYPSMPFFLKFNHELIKGMLRPIFDYAKTNGWAFDFAPHDVGLYPRLNGQYYGLCDETGLIDENMQMPVEECGNAIICAYAICRKEGNNQYALENEELLTKWANYLLKNGYRPKNQLCTDDFGGHFELNCNLSIKAIVAMYCYGKLFNNEEFKISAREFAIRFEEEALEGDHYKMIFDSNDTWSMKYNLVWDKIWGFGLFSDKVFDLENKYYMSKIERYGIPLDYRGYNGKFDWIAWAARMTDNLDDRGKIIDSLCNFANETRQKVPLCDWYDVKSGYQKIWAYGIEKSYPIGYANRSTVGGLSILMLN